MKRVLPFFFFLPLWALSQKKPLDHSVYDGWQSIGEKLVSNDGKWVVYTVVPQEGDGILYIRPVGDPRSVQQVPRGYNAVISEDSRYLVFRIKATTAETRDARIKKKKPEDLPKDSLGIITLGSPQVVKVARVKSFRMPEKGFGWLAYQKEREPAARVAGTVTQKTVDSLRHTVDSLTLLVTQLKNIKGGNRDGSDADDDPSASAAGMEGSDLVLRRLDNKQERTFKNIADYSFNPFGQKLVMRVTRPKDNAVLLCDLKKNSVDTILRGGNDFRSFAFTEDGSQLAFLAERDTNTKALQKFYGLYLYRSGYDSAALLVDKKSAGMQLGMAVSENGVLSFSKSGSRLFFGTAPILPPRDTTLVDFETAKLDIWNYKDDYLQTQQLFQLNNELKRNYLAVYDLNQNTLAQLGSKGLPTVLQTNEGDGDFFVAVTDTGRRVESQWTGSTHKDIYALDLRTGTKTLIRKNLDGLVYPSSTGRYILLYDNHARQYFAWNGKALNNITQQIKTPLYNEENDLPDDPSPYGIMGWHEKDSFVYIYDRYDIWRVDPNGASSPQLMFAWKGNRKSKTVYRYLRTDPEERFIRSGQLLAFNVFPEQTKAHFLQLVRFDAGATAPAMPTCLCNYSPPVRSKSAPVYVYTKESFSQSPELFVSRVDEASSAMTRELLLDSTNAQQSSYNWGTAELYHWKAGNGKPATGILYKPEDFDSTKKYPVLVYFYEKLSDGLFNYLPPAPTPSRLNIPFFVSRGYLVLAPDISYTKGHPGKDAYNYIVSGAQSLTKKKWVDAKNMGIQGQSWGGYQVAYLVTATNMFKAAWAGAPVVDMFSAYGGIRWESGNNRQFQYEKGQSRIGATPWDRPDLYVENSPFFHLKNITTPLVIMSNDADGAVPWYQGIEFFTAMRRLNKQVWLLNYNGEAHNLVERRNRKDIQIREQEYFDWLLKGAAPARWLTEGVPAVRKGRDWGLDL
jgi:dipeptidyl aminopeptidase/acylaminoacyl peptidase